MSTKHYCDRCERSFERSMLQTVSVRPGPTMHALCDLCATCLHELKEWLRPLARDAS